MSSLITPRMRRLVASLALPCAMAGLVSGSAAAEADTRGAGAARAAPPVRRGDSPVRGPEPVPWSGLGALSIGRGLRLNNPYRLATPLGDTAESISLAATYLDLGLALLIGERDFRQGVSLGGGVALQGIGQFVLTPSYLAQFGVTDTLGLRGRVGVPIVLAPDATLGLEAGFGSSLGLAYGVGAMLELVGSVFFGAATDETSITTIPMLSLQVGVFFEHQVSP